MKKLILFYCLFFSCLTYAQSNIVSSGGDGNSASGSFSYSLGQIDDQYLSGSGGSASSGVQQSYEVLTSNLNEVISVSLATYPNPVYDFMIVSISEGDFSNYSIRIKDGSGKQVGEYEFEKINIKIPFSHLNAGFYFIELYKSGQMIGQEKLIKR